MAPVVTVVDGNMKSTVSWTAVAGAARYQVFRTEGLEQCGQGKVLIATVESTQALTYTDTGLANGRTYYYIVIAKGVSDACFGPASTCTSVTPMARPGVELSCENAPHVFLVEPGQTPATVTRNCALTGVGGFTGTVNVGCASSSLTGVSCAVSSSSVSVSSTPSTVVLSIQATSSANGVGSISVTANGGGSLTSTSTIPVSVNKAGDPQVASYDNTYKAPRCLTYGSECSSSNLLDGRGLMVCHFLHFIRYFHLQQLSSHR